VTDSLLRDELLAGLPELLRRELFDAYNRIVTNYRERRWEPSELNGGKLCEVAYSILKGHVDGSFPARSTKPSNMVDACRALESATQVSRAARVQIPRILVALYEIRNNRGVGHIGGDVDPNHMDAECVLAMSKWIVAELIRIFHNVGTTEAAAAVDLVVERTLPVIWRAGEKLRVLRVALPYKDKVLLLLYQSAGWVNENDAFDWVEHSNRSVFRRDVLRPAHRRKFLEYDEGAGRLLISPLGIADVEDRLLPLLESESS
jgi:hypothetical protein